MIKCKKCGSTNTKGTSQWYKCKDCGAVVNKGKVVDTKREKEGEKNG